ncbi:MAG TPA: helix-turn-helix domain-containing protein, partial [Candidatus Pacearchaeota archaeon]|nr:helix-turn-helix domain-containing protein [Candidatus Pacearchaeota archaeon]
MKNKIKILRAEKGITQEELAEAVNVTRQTIIAI